MTWAEEIEQIAQMKRAPHGKFRVLMVDTCENPPLGEPLVFADCDDLEAAKRLADDHGSFMLPCHVYDDKGKHWFSAGRA